MTDNHAIIAFLRARLDEDEQSARDAGQARDADGMNWEHQHDVEPPTVGYRDPAARTDVAEALGNWPAEVAEHIARHDPARVLADIAAKRAILDLYAEHADQDNDDWWYEGAGGRSHGLGLAVRHHATIYAAHPAYDPTWTPTAGE